MKERNRDLKALVNKGKTIFLGSAIFLFTLELGSLLFKTSLVFVPLESHFLAVIRLAVTFVLGFLIYKGNSVAKTLYFCWMFIGLVVGLIILIPSFFMHLAVGLAVALLLLFYVFTIYFMIFSDSFYEFFKYQKKLYQ